MAWKVEYADTARKQLHKLEKTVAKRIVHYLDERVVRTGDPRQLGKALKGPLGDLWCYRVGDFRVLCDIHDGAMTVLVLQIANRREAYR